MAISKSLRFEIFKRDGFTCQYCGRQTPVVTLEVDHIIPRAEQGTDDPNNLVTACFDCNRGKGAVPLSIQKIKGDRRDELERLKERREQIAAYEEFKRQEREREDDEVAFLANHWCYSVCDGQSSLTEAGLETLRRFLKSLTMDDLTEAMDIAERKQIAGSEGRFKYFCGVCHNMIRDKTGDTSRRDYQEIERYYLNKGKTTYFREDRLRDLVKRYSKEQLKEAIDYGFRNMAAFDVGSYWKAFIYALEELTGDQIDY